jgi:Cytochrome P460
MAQRYVFPVFIVIALLVLTGWREDKSAHRSGPEYTDDGQLKIPQDYREWIYLSSGFDMSYNPAAQATSHHVFDNVFVDPNAYQAFRHTGSWPDKTILVLEVRNAQQKGSINERGSYQNASVEGLEFHVQDKTRFQNSWAFFRSDTPGTAKLIPQSADCYSCHAEHGAVDTTFVQFYPTLVPIAQKKHTFKSN